MIGKSGSNMGSVGAGLLMLISDAGASILHEFARAAQQSARPTAAPRKKGKIYKNFISLQLAFTGWIGPKSPANRF
jgi:hypothetical protein